MTVPCRVVCVYVVSFGMRVMCDDERWSETHHMLSDTRDDIDYTIVCGERSCEAHIECVYKSIADRYQINHMARARIQLCACRHNVTKQVCERDYRARKLSKIITIMFRLLVVLL